MFVLAIKLASGSEREINANRLIDVRPPRIHVCVLVHTATGHFIVVPTIRVGRVVPVFRRDPIPLGQNLLFLRVVQGSPLIDAHQCPGDNNCCE